eukprot:PhF_6_TR10982/c3_g1_i8/m.17760
MISLLEEDETVSRQEIAISSLHTLCMCCRDFNYHTERLLSHSVMRVYMNSLEIEEFDAREGRERRWLQSWNEYFLRFLIAMFDGSKQALVRNACDALCEKMSTLQLTELTQRVAVCESELDCVMDVIQAQVEEEYELSFQISICKSFRRSQKNVWRGQVLKEETYHRSILEMKNSPSCMKTLFVISIHVKVMRDNFCM